MCRRKDMPAEAPLNPRDILEAYKAQLPKERKIDLWFIIALLGAISSIIGPHIPLFNLTPPQITNIYSVSLVILVFVLIAYIVVREHATHKRYTEYAIFSHYINHIARDFLVDEEAVYQNGRDVIQDIVNAFETCMSITTGRKCYVSIKSYKRQTQTVEYLTIGSVCTDAQSSGNDISIDKFTSITSILSNETPRYFMSNDIIHAFKHNRYRHPDLETFSPYWPTPSWLKISIPANWKLFRSTIVLPIRHISKTQSGPDETYRAFLCIDCKSRNVFDRRYHTEIAAATADLLYAVMYKIEELSKQNTTPTVPMVSQR